MLRHIFAWLAVFLSFKVSHAFSPLLSPCGLVKKDFGVGPQRSCVCESSRPFQLHNPRSSFRMNSAEGNIDDFWIRRPDDPLQRNDEWKKLVRVFVLIFNPRSDNEGICKSFLSNPPEQSEEDRTLHALEDF